MICPDPWNRKVLVTGVIAQPPGPKTADWRLPPLMKKGQCLEEVALAHELEHETEVCHRTLRCEFTIRPVLSRV